MSLDFFLRNAAGFLIQLCPCVFLCFLPFPAERFRFPRRTVFLGAAAYSLATSLLFPGMLLYSGCFFYFLEESEYNAGGNLLFFLACAAAVAICG